MNANLDLFGFLLSMLVVIQLVHLTRDGMDMDVLIFLAHQVPTTMVPNVYVLALNLSVSHGSIIMEYNVCISHNSVQLVHIGIKLLASLRIMVALLVVMERINIVSHFHRDVAL